MQRKMSGDTTAEQMLVARNLRLVADIAGRYRAPGASWEDLVQEGSIGLLRAVRKFDPKLGYRFSTFAYWWIRQALSRFVKGPTRLIRLPEYVHDGIARVHRESRQMAEELGRDPSNQEVAARLGLEPARVEELIETGRDVASLEAPVRGTDGVQLEETLVDGSRREPPDELVARREKRAMVEGLKDLATRETWILAHRFGLADGRKRSRPWIAKELGISPERVRQIETDALGKLRRTIETRSTHA